MFYPVFIILLSITIAQAKTKVKKKINKNSSLGDLANNSH